MVHMKRHPSAKGRARISDSAGGADPYTSTLAERPRVSKRKQVDHSGPAVTDEQPTWEWTVQGLELTDRQQDS
jgi:hypothetical protein